MTPYSGSLLRLALTTVGILALAAAGLVYWQGGVAIGRPARDRFDLPRETGPVATAGYAGR